MEKLLDYKAEHGIQHALEILAEQNNQPNIVPVRTWEESFESFYNPRNDPLINSRNSQRALLEQIQVIEQPEMSASELRDIQRLSEASDKSGVAAQDEASAARKRIAEQEALELEKKITKAEAEKAKALIKQSACVRSCLLW